MAAHERDWAAFNEPVIDEFRRGEGKVGGAFEGNPMLLLTTTGARTGQTRVNPLTYTTDGERYVVIASKAGAPRHPDWYHNIVAHPEVVVEVGGERFAARAEAAAEPERTRLFAAQAALMPRFAGYQDKTSRLIPVVVLTRR